ncbi:hypothetical protein CRYUN_Cryun13aG0071400 [Craigia yunnanensis]
MGWALWAGYMRRQCGYLKTAILLPVYTEGRARPTGGAAAIAMLIGPNAPIAFESKFKGSRMSHAYDFYKPNLANGKLPQTCYLMALDFCYKHFCEKFEKLQGRAQFQMLIILCFIYNKLVQKSFARLFFNDFLRNARFLVQKSFARLFFNDFLRNASYIDEGAKEKLSPFSGLSNEKSYQSRNFEKASQQVAKHLYDSKVQPSTSLSKQVGNMYTASLYAAFASLLLNKHSSLAGKRAVMFSYGSGLTATIFSLKLQDGKHPFNLLDIATVMNVSEKLKVRHEFPPEKFVDTMKLMEQRYGAKDFVTSKNSSLVLPGTCYLTEVDSMYRRFYTWKANATTNILSTRENGFAS